MAVYDVDVVAFVGTLDAREYFDIAVDAEEFEVEFMMSADGLGGMEGRWCGVDAFMFLFWVFW